MKNLYLKNNQYCRLFFCVFSIIICAWPRIVLGDSLPAPRVFQVDRVELPKSEFVSHVAPGDSLPIAVKLINFGGNGKVDVFVSYTIINNKNEILHSEAETVAVETTASFIKMIPISTVTPPGDYTASVYIKYEGEKVTARSKFSFSVEKKYFGLFQSDFIKYGIITILLGIVMGALGHELFKQVRAGRLKPHDYSHIPKNERVFYELLSDTILEMRERVGDVALDIADQIDGLKIDRSTGRVLQIRNRPSRIIALLVGGYENALDKKVSFTFRKSN